MRECLLSSLANVMYCDHRVEFTSQEKEGWNEFCARVVLDTDNDDQMAIVKKTLIVHDFCQSFYPFIKAITACTRNGTKLLSVTFVMSYYVHIALYMQYYNNVVLINVNNKIMFHGK